MKFFKSLLFSIGFLFLSISAAAQQASIQGLISDFSTGEPLNGANIILESQEDPANLLGVSSGSDGYYRLGNITPGTWFLRISYIGYAVYRDTLTFRSGDNLTINQALQEDDAVLDELVVTRIVGATRRIEGAQRITPLELRRVPGPASGDLASYLQTLPGVVSLGDRGGQVFIRGGSPSENMVLVDGALIYQPSHIVGFFSPFPENLVAGADFYASGFSPKYTGRISSVLDIQMRSGDRFNTYASGAISPFAAEIFAEGPLIKGTSSWVFSARNSHIDKTSKWYPIEQQPLQFESQFLKGSFVQDDTRCSVMAMHSFDRGRIDFEMDESIEWRNFLMGGRCTALPENSSTLVTTNANFSRFSNAAGTTKPYGFKSSIMRLNFDLDLRQFYNNIRFDYGTYTRLKFLDYSLGELFSGYNDQSASQFLLGFHAQASIPVLDRIAILPGLGVSYNGVFGFGIEPRFRFTWQPFGNDSEEFSGSLGLYLQPITGINDIRDASSVFVAWMSSPIENNQMEALHATLGWQQSFGNGFTWSVEAYHKQMNRIATPTWNLIAEFTTDLALATGKVYGSDIRIDFNRGRFYGLLGYGYSWTLYESAQDHFNVWFDEPIQSFHPPHDRRHQINVLSSLEVGKYTFGARWQLGSGMPFTRPMGFDDFLDFRDRLPDVNLDRGNRRVLVDKPFEGRMPVVHRMDLSVERNFQISDSGSNINIQMGAINVYNQSNIFYYDLFTNRRIDQFSFAPYLTMKLEYR